MEAFMAALTYVLQPYHIGVIFFGTLIGILVGAMPGLSSIMGLSIMMPLTLSLEGNAGILMLLGIFCGAIYGGSITAILIKTPGTANSAAALGVGARISATKSVIVKSVSCPTAEMMGVLQV